MNVVAVPSVTIGIRNYVRGGQKAGVRAFMIPFPRPNGTVSLLVRLMT